MTIAFTRRGLLAAGAAAFVLSACGPGGPTPLHVVEIGSDVVRIYLDGQSAPTTITTKVAAGGAWSGNINGVSIAVQNGGLMINGRPYQGPAFTELHIFIKQGGAVETRIAKAKG